MGKAAAITNERRTSKPVIAVLHAFKEKARIQQKLAVRRRAASWIIFEKTATRLINLR